MIDKKPDVPTKKPASDGPSLQQPKRFLPRQNRRPRRGRPMGAPQQPNTAGSVRTDTPAPTEGQQEQRRPKRTRRDRGFGAPRKRLPSQRRLPTTQMHEGKVGLPGHLVGSGAEDASLKVIALGGLGEIGKNCYLLEYKDDIILIDAGIMFPGEDMPGIDFVIPNTAYVEEKLKNLRGIILTHGHLDHIGALPYLVGKLGNPDIYTAALTQAFVLKRHSEFPHLPKPNITVVKSGDRVKIGEFFDVEFFHMNHNIPDDLGVFIATPVGNFIHTADFKFDATPLNDQPVNLAKLREFGDRGVLALMCESTDAEKAGHSVSEQTIYDNMDIIFREATGMLLVGTFSSMINRIQQLVQLSEKYGRKVVFDGYSLKTNMEIAKEMGYLKIQKGTQISMEQINEYPRERVTVVATGAQGQEGASLMRIVNQEHRHLQIRKGDTVVFSSSVIPGNERSVQYLKDMLYRAGVRVYHYQMMDIHAGGHARQEDLKEIIALTRPKYLIPHHGQYSMMVTLAQLGEEMGLDRENIIVADNGQIIHLTEDHWWFDTKAAPSHYVMVDGLGIGDIGSVVLRDRQVLAEDGMFVIICVVDPRTGRIRTSPDIISRGFIYLKEQKDMLMTVRKKVRHIIESEKQRPMNFAYLKDQIRDDIGQFLFQKTERRPMVLPVIIEV